MDPVNLIVWIIVGAIAGWLEDIIVGIVGGFIGGILLNALNVGGAVTGLNITSILTAFIGAIVLLAVLRMVRRA